MGNERSGVVADERDRATNDRAQAALPAPASPWPMPSAPRSILRSAEPAEPHVAARPIDRVRRVDPQGPVVRRIVPKGRAQVNRYAEDDEGVLESISKKDYDAMDDDAPVTEERGYLQFKLERGEKATEWEVDERVLRWDGRTLVADRTFKLPVSCIESAEHIVNYSKRKKIPHWDSKQSKRKSVNLHMSQTNSDGESESVLAANLAKDDLAEEMPKYDSYNFDIYPVRVGEGLVAMNLDEPHTSLHAVAVVGVRTNGQIIVVERNAGTTSGSTNTLDNKWLLNVYASAEAFGLSMGADFVLGKLATY